MTSFDVIISLHGESVTVQRDTGSNLDDYGYGDEKPDYSSQGTETVWIQPIDKVRSSGFPLVRGVAGNDVEAQFIGFFKSDTVIQEYDKLVGTGTYKVYEIVSSKLFNSVKFKQAYLKLME